MKQKRPCKFYFFVGFLFILINPIIPMSDQDRISPHNINQYINQISDENKEK